MQKIIGDILVMICGAIVSVWLLVALMLIAWKKYGRNGKDE